MPDTNIKNIMKEKLGELISLDINKIQISEFNTRCQFVDNDHVKTLMVSIEEHGYIPKSAVWVNAIKGPDGEIINYRLVAGRHRYEACRRLEIKKIPAQLYYNLTDEEECELDIIDNKLDEHHKPINFLATAEHYRYLRDIKGWSQRKIADIKEVNRLIVQTRLQIAELSEEVKELLRGGYSSSHLNETYFREICKLNEKAHHLLVCHEIIASNQPEDMVIKSSTTDRNEFSYKKPMSLTDIKERVAELLTLEATGEIAPEALQLQSEPQVSSEIIEDTAVTSLTASPDEAAGIITEEVAEEKETKVEQLQFDIFSEISDTRVTGAKPKEFRFSIIPMWVKHTDLIDNMCGSAYHLLQELISYDFRYKPEKDSLFFVKYDDRYQNCVEFLSRIIGVKPNTFEKKALPGLKEYVFYKKSDSNLKFQIKWEKLYKVYRKNAHLIPFDDGGLKDIPPGYTGWIRPTPFHSIYIENGMVKDSPHDTNEITATEMKKEKPRKKPAAAPAITPATKAIDTSPLAEKLRELNMGEEQINFCLEQRETAENVLKYVSEMPPAEKQKIKNMAGYVYSTVKNGFKAPEKFETVKATEDRKERKIALEEFGEKIKEAMDKGEIKYFCPGEGKKYLLSSIPSPQVFLYNKKGKLTAGHFSEWLDNRFFTD